MIETSVIKMEPKKMLSVLFLQNGMPWTIGAVSGIIICVILGIALNYKFFFLALIWMFLFVPLMVAFLYFFYGLKPLTAFNSIPHKIFFNGDKITIQIEENEDIIENKEIKDKQDMDGNPSNTIYSDSPKNYSVSKTDFQQIRNGSDYVILSSKKYGWLWLPVSSFPTAALFKSTIESLYGFLTSNS